MTARRMDEKTFGRSASDSQLQQLGYTADWRLLNASEFGVPQLRPQVVIVAKCSGLVDRFEWPAPIHTIQLLSVRFYLILLLRVAGKVLRRGAIRQTESPRL